MAKFPFTGVSGVVPFTEENCKAICKLDGVEADIVNVSQVYLCISLWYLMGIDVGFPNWRSTLPFLLASRGMTGTSELLCNVAAKIANREFNGMSEGGEVYIDAVNYVTDRAIPVFTDPSIPYESDDVRNMGHCLQLLRFAKRFTYLSDLNDHACYEKFLACNAECYCGSDAKYRPKSIWKQIVNRNIDGVHVEIAVRRTAEESEGARYTGPGYTLFAAVRDHVRDLIGDGPIDMRPYSPTPWKGVHREWLSSAAPREVANGGFSDGSAWNPLTDKTVRTKADKLKAFYSTDCLWDGTDGYYRITTFENFGSARASLRPWDLYLLERKGSNMIAVPKSMSEKRLISPEPVRRAHFSFALRKCLEHALESSGGKQYLNWEDQMSQQYRAMLGSVGEGWSTIDASAASDRMSRDYTFALLPHGWRPYFWNAISDYVRVEGKTVPVRCFSTSGNQITWLTLGIVMWSIADYGCSWYTDSEGNPLHAFAYGDDLTVPDVAYETVIELLERFGFKINEAKSYTAGDYFRESCGGDYYLGYNVTPKYWRRGIVDVTNKPDVMQFICEMQHKLYRFHMCRNFLYDVAKRLDPQITASPVGAECDDLWDGNLDPMVSLRSQHRMLKSKRPQSVESYLYNYEEVQWHQYVKFLKDGPRYNSDQDRQMGISSSYLGPDLFTSPELEWGWSKKYYK